MWAEELTRPYGTGTADRRPSLEASRLLLQSEGSLTLENFSEAVRLAEQSLSAFRQFGDTRGQADAARLLSVAMIHQDRRKEADRLLKDELAIFQTSANSGSKSAEARLLLALADVNSDRRGQKKREEALRFVGQARSLSVDEADAGLQASSLAVMAKIFIKYKGDQKACNKEALRLGTQALQLYEQTNDSRGRAISSHHCAIAQGNLGEIAASLQYINDSASFWRKAEDLIMEANAQLMMGGLLLKGGAARQAVSAAESALASYRNCHVTGSRELRAVQLAVRAHIGNGEPWRAIWTAEDAVARYRERRDRPNEAQALLSLASGYTFSPSGREEQEVPVNMQTKMTPPKEAVDTLQRALQIARELNDSVLEAQVMSHLSNMHVKRTEMEEAIFAAHDALSHREVKDVEGKGVAFQSLTSAHLHNKDFADAERAARAQRDFSRREGHWSGDAQGQLSMAEVLCAERKFDEAVDCAKEAQNLFAEHKDRKGEARALLQVAKARLGAAEYEKALHVAERAQELFLRVNDLLGKCEALRVMAECRSKLLVKQQGQSTLKLRGRKANAKAPLPWEDLSRAATVSKQAKDAAKEVGDVQAEAAALCVIAQIHVFNGRPQQEILETLDDAMALAIEAGDSKTEATALLLKAETHLQAEELQDALKAARQAELLLKSVEEDGAKAKVEEILNKLRGHEFRVDEAPARQTPAAYGYDPRLALPLVAGPDPELVKKTIQEVTKKMVGKEDDLEQDLPLMDLGINSTNAVIFRNKLTSEFQDVELPSTLIFDYPTVRSLFGLVIDQTTSAAQAANASAMAQQMPHLGMPYMAMAPQRTVDPSIVTNKIQEVIKGMVGSDHDIDRDMPLMDIGINIMNAVVFRNKLGSTFDGAELPSTLVFDFPSIRAMTDLMVQLTE